MLCVDALAERAKSGELLNSNCISLLEEILNARTLDLKVPANGVEVDVAEYCRNRILGVLPEILEPANGEDVDYFREVCLLIPQLADSSPDVIRFLQGSASKHQGELRRMRDEALEEAEEVLRDGHMP